MKILNGSERWNLHTHTRYCDGKDEPETLIKRALALGFTRLGFSGHGYALCDLDVCMTPEKTAAYQKEILALKETYRDKIEILLGIEQDFYGEPLDFPYDYVIGSVHYIQKGQDYLCVDDSSERFLAEAEKLFGGDLRDVVEAYYDNVGRVVEQTGCNIVGHFDLITKFNREGRFFDEGSQWYRDAALAAMGKVAQSKPKSRTFFGPQDMPVIEINTGAMAKGYQDRPYPDRFLLEAAERLGFPLVLSSDCHNAEFLDYKFPELIEELV